MQKVEKSKHDIAVLNSVANIQKAMDFLKSHREISTYLDNDDAGQKATKLIKSNCVSVNNRSERYTGFKDLNDYLCQKPMVKPEVKKKKSRLKQNIYRLERQFKYNDSIKIIRKQNCIFVLSK